MKLPSRDYAQIVYCSAAIIHADCDPQAGAPRFLGVLHEYACGTSSRKPMHIPG